MPRQSDQLGALLIQHFRNLKIYYHREELENEFDFVAARYSNEPKKVLMSAQNCVVGFIA